METRKIIIYALFVLAVVYGFYFHFLNGRTAQKESNASDVDRGKGTSSAVAAVPSQLPEQARPTANRPDDKWVKNPFKNDRNRVNITPAQAAVSIPDMNLPHLSAISSVRGEKMAIVDDKIMRVGGRIESWRLERITDDSALFSGPDGFVWVKLGGLP